MINKFEGLSFLLSPHVKEWEGKHGADGIRLRFRLAPHTQGTGEYGWTGWMPADVAADAGFITQAETPSNAERAQAVVDEQLLNVAVQANREKLVKTERRYRGLGHIATADSLALALTTIDALLAQLAVTDEAERLVLGRAAGPQSSSGQWFQSVGDYDYEVDRCKKAMQTNTGVAHGEIIEVAVIRRAIIRTNVTVEETP